MRKRIHLLFWVIGALITIPGLVSAQSSTLTPEDLDKLLAPIALYPDPLLAQIFPAASHPKQIAAADQYVTTQQDPNQISTQPWDPSVQALAHYPSVLKMMDDRPDWTAHLGQAYTTQPSDVFAAVQRLRAKAQTSGNLQTTPQQVVASDNNVITVMPANPQTIYVPEYSPEVVYNQPAVNVVAPLVTFGAGFALGGWIHNEVNWGSGTVYYHPSGWSSSYSYGWSSSYHSGWSSSYHSESSSSSSSSSSYHRGSSSSSSSSSSDHRWSNSHSSSQSGRYNGRNSHSRSWADRHDDRRSGSRSGYRSARESNNGSRAGRNAEHRGNRPGREGHERGGRERGEHRGGGHHGGGHHGGGGRR